MEIMNAFTARVKTIDAIQARYDCLLKKIDARITATISKGQFECNFQIDSPAVQDGLFDYLTSLGYVVKFMPNEKNGKKYYDPDSRIMNVSWEDAVQ